MPSSSRRPPTPPWMPSPPSPGQRAQWGPSSKRRGSLVRCCLHLHYLGTHFANRLALTCPPWTCRPPRRCHLKGSQEVFDPCQLVSLFSTRCCCYTHFFSHVACPCAPIVYNIHSSECCCFASPRCQCGCSDRSSMFE